MNDEDLAIRRKRLLYQALHRGTKEGDRVIGGFVEKHIGGMDAGQMDQLESLIAETDADLMDWISGRAPVPVAHKGPVFELIKNFKNIDLNN